MPHCEDLNGSTIAWNEICGSECIARLLSRKGFQTPDDVQSFLRPRLSSLSDPFLLPQVDLAVFRILDALGRHERIEDYQQAMDWGIDLIQTDYPLRLMRAIELRKTEASPGAKGSRAAEREGPRTIEKQ